MRILRLAIRNFRGVDACELVLPATGVTVIVGPNEVGKSSLAEALDLLFDYPHDSRHRHVLAVKPVNRDVGTEVEAELTTGPYHLVYRKRWFRQPETDLQVLSPRAERMTARSAHERMEQILHETLDRDLFRALRWVQGARAEHGGVGASTSLFRALDAAAGGRADPEAESTLWEAIEAERARYFTPTGRVSQQREQLAVTLHEAEVRAERAREALADLEAMGEQYRATLAQLERKGEEEVEAAEELDRARQAGDALDAADHNVLERTAEQERAERMEAAARHAQQARLALVADVDDLAVGLGGLDHRLAEAEPAHAAAVAAVERLRVDHRRAESACDAARADVERADGDRDFRRAQAAHGLLTARLRRLAEARQEEAAAQRVLEGSVVTGRARASVEAAVGRVAEARAARRAGSPVVAVEALAEVEVTVDGHPVTVAAGQAHEVAVDGSAVIGIGGQVLVRVAGGVSSDELATEVADAERALAALVGELGLDPGDPLGSLARALDARRDAGQAVQQAARSRAEALADLSEGQLAAQAAQAQDLVAHYLHQRADSAPLPDTVEAADDVHRHVVEVLRGAESAEHELRRELAACTEQQQARRVEVETLRELHRQQRQRLRSAESALGAARDQRGDPMVADDLVAATESADKARAATVAARADRQALDPDSTRLRLDNARHRAERLRREHQQLDGRRIELRTALREKGQADLQAAVDAEEAHVERIRAERDDVERRAAAAKLLHDSFARHRDAARLAYVAPYKHQIERLARLVFGADTTIDVDPQDFAITTRTLGGVTVPHESLSTGAREQLGVIARLACAILVHDSGDDGDAGVPVILDDALGCTDPDRLRRVAPAFAAAAARSQIVVMTCHPERYAGIGDATVIELPGTGTTGPGG